MSDENEMKLFICRHKLSGESFGLWVHWLLSNGCANMKNHFERLHVRDVHKSHAMINLQSFYWFSFILLLLLFFSCSFAGARISWAAELFLVCFCRICVEKSGKDLLCGRCLMLSHLWIMWCLKCIFYDSFEFVLAAHQFQF